MFINNGFIENWLDIIIQASSFAPLIDAICPWRFLIDWVNGNKSVGEEEAVYYKPFVKLKNVFES